MSPTISFQTYDPATDRMVTADVPATERVYVKGLLDRIALAALRVDLPVAQRRARYERLLPPQHILHRQDNNYAWWTGFVESFTTHADQRLRLPVDANPLELILNTALVAGATSIEFLARFHATCELHGFVEADDRVWLAEIIDLALVTGVLSTEGGWESVVSLLIDGPGGAVVMEASNGHLVMADIPHTVPLEQRWHQAIDELRDAGDRRIDRKVMGSAAWGAGWSMFDVERWLDAQQLEEQATA